MEIVNMYNFIWIVGILLYGITTLICFVVNTYYLEIYDVDDDMDIRFVISTVLSPFVTWSYISKSIILFFIGSVEMRKRFENKIYKYVATVFIYIIVMTSIPGNIVMHFTKK